VLRFLLELLNQPRRLLALVSLICLALLSFGLYLQHGLGLEPCPMCIVQRYLMVLMAMVAAVGAFMTAGRVQMIGLALTAALAAAGAFVAARQSWLQWFPPEVYTCGRDFYGMIETFPLKRAIPMIFRGSGDCTKIDWTLLGLSIANWSFVAFFAMGLWCVGLLVSRWRLRQTASPCA
jgi:disulfide bond formation protein DsbB